MMEEQDKKRREEFHKYEMEKEHKRREDMKNLSEEERKMKEHEHEEQLKNLRKHEKMHQPVNLFTFCFSCSVMQNGTKIVLISPFLFLA